MALISCKECGNQVSDTISSCPHCGYSFESTKKDSGVKKLGIVVGIISIFVVCLLFIFIILGVLILSSTPKTYTLPDVVNDYPTSLLLYNTKDDDNVNFEIKQIEEYSDDVLEGQVISMTPSAGTEVTDGAIVTLVISKGKDPSKDKKITPIITGLLIEDAKKTLIEFGYPDDFDIVYEYSNTVEKDIVISCSVEGNTILNEYSYEYPTIVVSLGSEKEFIDKLKKEAKSVTYDDLIRYPETYMSQPIKITVTVSDIEINSFLGIEYDEKIWGSIGDKTIILEDDRNVKEPALLSGDTVTVYGYGNDLSIINIKEKEYQGSLVFGFTYDKTTDSYHVPNISIKYLELN